MTITTVHTMSPAYDVIERLGGKTIVANALRVDKSTLSRWCQPRPQGTGGFIPRRYWGALLHLARGAGVTIDVVELAAVEE